MDGRKLLTWHTDSKVEIEIGRRGKTDSKDYKAKRFPGIGLGDDSQRVSEGCYTA